MKVKVWMFNLKQLALRLLELMVAGSVPASVLIDSEYFREMESDPSQSPVEIKMSLGKARLRNISSFYRRLYRP